MSPRTVVYTELFEQELREIGFDQKIADEFVRAAEWTLARRPESGTRISQGTPVWFLPIVDVPWFEQLALYYTFDAETVFFISIWVSDEPRNDLFGGG